MDRNADGTGRDARAPASRSDQPADRARGPIVVLHRPWQQVLFIAGLVGLVLLAVMGGLWYGY
ncbi:MAG: hypothetical protein HXY25_12180 [Alphaproteobacteria bacterium]|nr:hypothetical protein [Alphaproteobacteria bacterium]